jgi:hypothetical protein
VQEKNKQTNKIVGKIHQKKKKKKARIEKKQQVETRRRRRRVREELVVGFLLVCCNEFSQNFNFVATELAKNILLLQQN